MSITPALLAIQLSTSTAIGASRRASGLYRGYSGGVSGGPISGILFMGSHLTGWRSKLVGVAMLLVCLLTVAIWMVSAALLIAASSWMSTIVPGWLGFATGVAAFALWVTEIWFGIRLLYGR